MYKTGLHLKFGKIILKNIFNLFLYKSALAKYLCNWMKKLANVWWLEKNSMTESNLMSQIYLTTFKGESTFLWLIKT